MQFFYFGMVLIIVFIAALFTIAKTWKQPKCPSAGEWVKMMRCIYYNGQWLSHKRKKTGSLVEICWLCYLIFVSVSDSELIKCWNFLRWPAAAAAKSLQSCPTLCDPIDSSPPGSPTPGILQARTLEWIAISFSNAWKWRVKVKSLSSVRLFATPWTAAHQAPPSMGFSRQVLEWGAIAFSIRWPRNCHIEWS